MIFVLDTNVYVSAVVNKSGHPAMLERAWKSGKLEVALSRPILQELGEVLSYPRIRKLHHKSPQEIREYLRDLKAGGVVVPGITSVQAVKDDPSDNKFLACAVEAKAYAVVTGDQHLIKLSAYKGIPIITPRQCVEAVKRNYTA